MHTLDWNDLRYVQAVADAGSLVRAARALGVNHTTVLRRIAALEEQLGVRLFERLPSGYALTAAGEEVVLVARQMGETVAGVERRLMGKDLRLTGTVRLATTDTLALTVLGPHLAAFARASPEVTIELTASNTMVSLTRRDADIALRPSKQPPENLVGRKCSEVAIGLYASPAYLERTPARRELLDHTWVGPDESLSGTTIGRWMARELGGGKVALKADSLVVLREAALAGMGVSPLPCYLGDTAPGLRRVRPPVPELATELWLLTHEDLQRTARVRALLDHLALAMTAERDLLEGRRPLRPPER